VSATEKGRRQRAHALQQVIAYLLSEGLEETGLRRLAQAADTSDRMLIYYFGSKEALLREAFAALSDALLAKLESQFPKAAYSPKKLKKISLALAEDPAALGTLKLWFELLGRALRPDAPLKVQAQVGASLGKLAGHQAPGRSARRGPYAVRRNRGDPAALLPQSLGPAASPTSSADWSKIPASRTHRILPERPRLFDRRFQRCHAAGPNLERRRSEWKSAPDSALPR